VSIGGTDACWQSASSGYRDGREFARGQGLAMWIALPGHASLRLLPRSGPPPVRQVLPLDAIANHVSAFRQGR
jgi:hypothetical protein